MDIKSYRVHEELRDGSKVLVRAIHPDDKEAIARAIEQLSDGSHYRRFFSFGRNTTNNALKTATEIDFMHEVALVVESEGDGEKEIIAGCRYIAMDEHVPCRRAEVAFTILDTWQGKGLGTLLFQHLAAIGRSSGIEQFEAIVLPSNKGMTRIFTKAGLKTHQQSEGEDVCFTIEL